MRSNFDKRLEKTFFYITKLLLTKKIIRFFLIIFFPIFIFGVPCIPSAGAKEKGKTFSDFCIQYSHIPKYIFSYSYSYSQIPKSDYRSVLVAHTNYAMKANIHVPSIYTV